MPSIKQGLKRQNILGWVKLQKFVILNEEQIQPQDIQNLFKLFPQSKWWRKNNKNLEVVAKQEEKRLWVKYRLMLKLRDKRPKQLSVLQNLNPSHAKQTSTDTKSKRVCWHLIIYARGLTPHWNVDEGKKTEHVKILFFAILNLQKKNGYDHHWQCSSSEFIPGWECVCVNARLRSGIRGLANTNRPQS